MLGWILGAQPTATTQYPIVHLPRYFEDKGKDKDKDNKAIKDGGSTAGLPPNNKQKDHQ